MEKFFNLERRLHKDQSERSSTKGNRNLETDSMKLHALENAPDPLTNHDGASFSLQFVFECDL